MADVRCLLLLAFGLMSMGCLAQDAFPDDFIFGVATASYQIEGGWDADGKGENIWDRLTHDHPDYITDGSNGDVACDSYNLWARDVEMLTELGVDFYRFSFSWSRILPTGHTDQINQAGIDYYNNLIDALVAAGIEPVATMYHWDLPQPIQDLGGWPNEVTAQYFGEYARVLFENFGDRVKRWITLNEPKNSASGYAAQQVMAPGIDAHGIGDYLATHTLIKAHATAYHLYDDEFRATQNGVVGITLDQNYCRPIDDTQESVDAAERCQQFGLGWYAHPIFSEEGDYPQVMKDRIGNNSEAEGRGFSRLPSFTQEEIEYIRGTFDFFGLNHYTSVLTENGEAGEDPSRERDGGYINSYDPDWPPSASDWLYVVPEGIRNIINWVQQEYNNPPILITENGFSDTGGLDDVDRQNYYKQYLRQVLLAINEDGANVIGYTAWSLMDNFEWMRGYTQRFGLYLVDFEDEARTRTAKGSVALFQEIISTHQVPEDDTEEIAEEPAEDPETEEERRRNMLNQFYERLFKGLQNA